MTKSKKEGSCVLGLAPSTRGIGYAVMSGEDALVDWGVKPVKSGNKNERSLAHAANLMDRYLPGTIALEDLKPSKSTGRVRELLQQIAILAQREKIKVHWLSRPQVHLEILKKEHGTKHALAQALAARFPEQLGFRVPKKRQNWTGEPYQSDIFRSVALARCSVTACKTCFSRPS